MTNSLKEFYENNTNHEDFESLRGDFLNLEYYNETFSIVVPRTLDEIKNEGDTLHHAVAYYANKILRKENIILFLRKNRDIEKPFYTIEIVNNKVTMIKGFQNREIHKEQPDFYARINEFIEDWKKEKKLL